MVPPPPPAGAQSTPAGWRTFCGSVNFGAPQSFHSGTGPAGKNFSTRMGPILLVGALKFFLRPSSLTSCRHPGDGLPPVNLQQGWHHWTTDVTAHCYKNQNIFQISHLQLFEMIDELFADTVVISHHEKLFITPPPGLTGISPIVMLNPKMPIPK